MRVSKLAVSIIYDNKLLNLIYCCFISNKLKPPLFCPVTFKIPFCTVTKVPFILVFSLAIQYTVMIPIRKTKESVGKEIMNVSERRRKIIELLVEGGDIPVSKISNLLEVSVVTIRNDLNSLVEEGLIVRTHGGALPAFHQSIVERQAKMMEEKHRIAKAAADQVNDGDKIMIIAGTTAVLMAKHLLGKRDIHIVTNSTLIFPYARINPSLHVTLVGGEFRPSAEGIVGALALKNLDQFHVKTAFLGADGFSLKTGVTSDLLETAEVGRKMAEHSERLVLLADSSKYGRAGFALIVPINRMDLIITDNNLPGKEMDLLKESGLSVVAV